MLMRQLQALDLARAGARHRQIAEAIFGAEAVAADWSRPGGVLKRRTRYLVQRGTALMNGAYRRLLRPLRVER